MTAAVRPFLFSSFVVPMLALAGGTIASAAPKPDSYWRVEDIRPGMKGVGRTVMKGTKVESFQAEVLGVLKNTSPGRDMVLCRLSGLNLEKTGVIAGMSGSPVYIDDKLLGAVAYAWPYGKEPIAGITPFCQMHGFVEAFERRDLAEPGKPTRVGLRQPLVIDGKEFDSVTVSQGFDDASGGTTDGLWMMPLRTPLSATGFTRNSLKLLQRALRSIRHGADAGRRGAGPHRRRGEGRAAGAGQSAGCLADPRRLRSVRHRHRHPRRGQPRLRLGPSVHGPRLLRVSADDRLHHTVYPRQTVSFKMGSPLKSVGVINADVSTCIAGWLGRKADMLPVRMTVTLGAGRHRHARSTSRSPASTRCCRCWCSRPCRTPWTWRANCPRR